MFFVVGLVKGQDSFPSQPPEAAQPATSSSSSKQIVFDDFVDSVVRQERHLTDLMRSFKPIIETYIQEEGSEPRFQQGITPNGDDYFLSRLNLTGNSLSTVPFADEETWNQGGEKFFAHDTLPFNQIAFAQALFPDFGHFDRQNYSSNIMSLGGLALAIGVLVDAAIVMVENGYRHLSEHPGQATESERVRILIDAPTQVGLALFFSLLIIVVLFPSGVFAGSARRTHVPSTGLDEDSRRGLLIVAGNHPGPPSDGDFHPGEAAARIGKPDFKDHPGTLFAGLTALSEISQDDIAAQSGIPRGVIPPMFRIGSQFMPPLFEGSSLYMPTALPGISITQVSQLLQEQDRILRSFPEVQTVFGAVGRSDSATDNAPLDMLDTTIVLKPRKTWRAG